MKETAKRLIADPKYSKALEWGKLISITGSAQLIVQITGLVSGILIIRLLPKEEYALYTLANSMLGTMTVLADGGIASGVMAQGGKVWQDKLKLGAVLSTGIDLRRKFAIASFLIALPVLWYLLMHHGASILTTVLIIAALIPAFYSALSDSLLEIVPKLHQNIKPLQKNQVSVNCVRLVLAFLSLFVFPMAFVAVLANGIPRMIGNIKLWKIAGTHADASQSPDPVVKKEILSIVKRSLPTAVYYCLSSQITIWLISVFGTTDSLAKMGALGRLSMLLALFTVLFGTLVTPRFARLASNYNLLLKRYFQIIGGVIFLMSCVVGTVWLFPNQILWVLGKDYQGLGSELVMVVMGSCLSLISAVSFALYTCRGWVLHPTIALPLNLASIVSGILLFNLSTFKGVLMFNIYTSLVLALITSIYCVFKISKLKTVKH